MSPVQKYLLGAGVVVVLSWLFLPNLLFTLVVLGVIAAPIVGYLMLDPSQRARLKRIRRRGIDR
ncbi:hypothetical protein [Streptosporangium carneum]|uniref:Uncharacterized protein n=1 Tax=Streptosporangium carneum TaxID=47481 RepID=A0A9W6HY66_9ACTN|nr:hypothetical protein [Streptosporangium carneum]GLK08257.1 hypothetical protein GCM10017600_16620 [Streptosporangium carneum]